MIRVLALDSLVNVLNIYERAWVHQQRFKDKEQAPQPLAVKCLYHLIEAHQWQPPAIKYSECRSVIWFDEAEKQWKPIKTYKHQILKIVRNGKRGQPIVIKEY